MPERQEDKPTLLETAKEKLHYAGEKASGAVETVKGTIWGKHETTPVTGVSRELPPEPMPTLPDQPREQHGMLDTVKEKVYYAAGKASDVAGSLKETVLHRRDAQPAAHVSTEEIAARTSKAVPEHAEAVPEHTPEASDQEARALKLLEPEQDTALKIEEHATRSDPNAVEGFVLTPNLEPNVPSVTGSAPGTTAGGGGYTQRMKDAAEAMKEHVAAAAEAVKQSVWVSHPTDPEKQIGKLPGEMNIEKETGLQSLDKQPGLQSTDTQPGLPAGSDREAAIGKLPGEMNIDKQTGLYNIDKQPGVQTTEQQPEVLEARKLPGVMITEQPSGLLNKE